MRVWIPRLLALVALVAAGGATVYAVTSVESTSELTVDEAADLMTRLNEANARLSGLLEALEPGDSPAEAQEAVRSAAELTRTMVKDAPEEGSLADRLGSVLEAELDYLDALGSTLNNPRSSLRGTIGTKQIALKDQLRSIPNGDPDVVAGGQELIAYSRARTGEA